MPKNVAIAIGVGVVAVVGAVLIFFNDDNAHRDPDQLAGPDSGEYEDNQGPDSGDDYDTDTLAGPDSGDEEDNQGPDSGDEVDLNEPTSPDSGDEIALSDDLARRAKGSCNVISQGSTCVEYVGSYWTRETARLNCSDSAAFSTKPCPRPALGGCRMGADTPTEIVTWHYDYGGDPYTEAIGHAAQACRALPGGWWLD